MAIAKQFTNRYPILRSFRTVLAGFLLLYLKLLAKIALLFFHGSIIGIAGSVGKSTTRNALFTILTNAKKTYVVAGNSETGIPLGLLNLSPGVYSIIDWLRILLYAPLHILNLHNYSYLIVEMGIDGPKAPKNMDYLLTIVKPDIAILLSESPAHIEHYESILPNNLKNKTQAEQLSWFTNYLLQDDGKILNTSTIQTAIIDATDAQVFNYAKKTVKHNLFTAGFEDQHDIQIHYHEVTPQGTIFGFSIHTHQLKEYLHIVLPSIALPKESAASIACAILTAIHCGVDISIIKENLENHFSLPPGRGNIIEGKNNTIIIDSSYNASPASMSAFLHLLKEIKHKWKRSTVTILGDMKELGSYAEYAHREVAKELIESTDHVILVGQLTKQCMLPYLEKHKDKFKSIISLSNILEIQSYVSQIPQESILMVKGSQFLEEAIKTLLKNHKDTQLLCRQNEFWKKSKMKRNLWIEV